MWLKLDEYICIAPFIQVSTIQSALQMTNNKRNINNLRQSYTKKYNIIIIKVK